MNQFQKATDVAITSAAQQVIATFNLSTNPKTLVVSAVPAGVTINGFTIQILPAHINYEAAVDADWMTLVKDTALVPATQGAQVISTDPLGLSALTTGVEGFAHVVLPPTRGVRILAKSSAGSGTITVSIGE